MRGIFNPTTPLWRLQQPGILEVRVDVSSWAGGKKTPFPLLHSPHRHGSHLACLHLQSVAEVGCAGGGKRSTLLPTPLGPARAHITSGSAKTGHYVTRSNTAVAALGGGGSIYTASSHSACIMSSHPPFRHSLTKTVRDILMTDPSYLPHAEYF